jgi:shikimate dehydrogenase
VSTGDTPIISGKTRVYGLVGHPVRHSLSPAMYNALFARFGIDAVYVAMDVHPDAADQVADAIRVLDLVGVNLTVPFKEQVVPHLDRVTQAAQEAGAVNVLTCVGGTLTGYNTDGEGFVRSLAEEDGASPEGATAIVLGAGGAARAIAGALLDRGVDKLHLLNRTVERASRAAEALQAHFPNATIRAAGLDADTFATVARGATLTVNCTSGGARSAVESLDPAVMAAEGSWVDINYWMPDPPLRAACATHGIRFHDGLGMLAHQGALAFELFTGYPVTGAEIRAFLSEQRP